MSTRSLVLTPDLLLGAYRLGLFPMAQTRASRTLHFLDPDSRGVLPLEGFHLPRRLARTLRSGAFTVTSDRDFRGVIAGCAEAREDRPETWINAEIEQLFCELHDMGYAHSIETWQGGALVGGLYGLALGGAYFGESMFSRARDASKLALVHLVMRLRRGGFSLLDTQFLTPHLARFGTVEVPRRRYQDLLADALDRKAPWIAELDAAAMAEEIAALRLSPASLKETS
ncbi:MAG TPA: leucyl/phenylalanyl-tRNA--protein transferase [Acetobacteraceae bacterium]|nr:leucyl/phenylalanyl-tRNA--protein transferase [Acetobacteraceae bacterium]